MWTIAIRKCTYDNYSITSYRASPILKYSTGSGAILQFLQHRAVAFLCKKAGNWTCRMEYAIREVTRMIAAVWLMLSGLMYALQLSTGSFPKPLTEEEENYYLDLVEKGDLAARNVLIERNLRLVAHIMNYG